jgi:hypothetical protein
MSEEKILLGCAGADRGAADRNQQTTSSLSRRLLWWRQRARRAAGVRTFAKERGELVGTVGAEVRESQTKHWVLNDRAAKRVFTFKTRDAF